MNRRGSAITAGSLYLTTHVTSVAALVMYGPVLHHPDYITGSGSQSEVLVGGLLEVVLALAVVGTAVTLYPTIKEHSPAGALAYAALRTLEAATIIVGVVALLAVVTLRQDLAAGAGTDHASLVVGQALVAVHNWTFLIGPGLVCGTNTIVLAHLLHRSGLVARFIPWLGLAGGPIVIASNIAVMFGAYAQESRPAAIGALPIFAWEVSLAIHLICRGFITRTPATTPDTSANVPALAPA